MIFPIRRINSKKSVPSETFQTRDNTKKALYRDLAQSFFTADRYFLILPNLPYKYQSVLQLQTGKESKRKWVISEHFSKKIQFETAKWGHVFSWSQEELSP